MFFWNDPKTPLWKVELGRELKSRKVVANMYDDCIEMCNVFGLKAPLDFPNLKSSKTLVGVIELNREDTLLVAQPYVEAWGCTI